MIIRLVGGEGGIVIYFETGMKEGRIETRLELDDRVIVLGDIETLDEVIGLVPETTEAYLHVTLSFREDFLESRTLRAVAKSFEGFITSAYRTGELYCFAEAHVPRKKSYRTADGVPQESSDRKGHLHFVIPKVDLRTGELTDPLGLAEQNLHFLDAFQELMNSVFGFVSPKDSFRSDIVDGGDMMSRKGAANLEALQSTKKTKKWVLDQIMACDRSSMGQLKTHLEKHGKVSVRHSRTSVEYLHFVPKGKSKGVNLRSGHFQADFLDLPKPKKVEWLVRNSGVNRFVRQGPPRELDPMRTDALKEWHKTRAKEVKYLSGYPARWREYAELDVEGKAELLGSLEKEFYERTGDKTPLISAPTKDLESTSGRATEGPALLALSPTSLGSAVLEAVYSVLDVVLEPRLCGKEKRFNTVKVISDLEARFVARPEKFGGPIRGYEDEGGVGLFKLLRRHFCFTPLEALRYVDRQGLTKPKALSQVFSAVDFEASRLLSLQFRERKKKLQELEISEELKAKELKLLQMSLALSRQLMWAQGQLERQNGPELKRRDQSEQENTMSASGGYAVDRFEQNFARVKDWSYEVLDSGHIQYVRRQVPVIRDEGARVVLDQIDREAVAVALRVALLKYGTKIHLSGSQEFKSRAADVAGQLKLDITFDEPWVQELLTRARGQREL